MDVNMEREMIYKSNDINIVMALSELRKNIIGWFPIREDADILEIGGNYGEITEELCRKGKTITVEPDTSKAELIYERLKKVSNLEIISKKLNEIKFEKSFDYITLIGCLENIDSLYGEYKDSSEAFFELLKYLKTLLKPSGKILLAFDNKYGIKYWAGAVNNRDENAYKAVFDEKNILYKDKVQEIIKNAGFDKMKFYYPLPDYKLANVIYSSDYLPKPNEAKLRYYAYYNDYSNIIFNEIGAINTLAKDGKFEDFANSYFVEISNDGNLCDTKFASFNNLRKREKRLLTRIVGDKVYKESIEDESKQFMDEYLNNLERIKMLGFNSLEEIEDNKVVSPYLDYMTLTEKLVEYAKKENISLFYDTIGDWYEKIKNLLGITQNGDSEGNKSDLNYTSNGFIDLTFDNVFVNNNEYYVFDQEWFKSNIPVEFVLYRSICNMYEYNPELNKIVDKNDVLNKFNLSTHEDYFKELEEQFRNEVTDSEIVEFYNSTYKNVLYLNDLVNNYKEMINNNEKLKENVNYFIENENKLNEKINELNKIIESQNEELNTENNKINKLNSELMEIKKTKTWKLINYFKRNGEDDRR